MPKGPRVSGVTDRAIGRAIRRRRIEIDVTQEQLAEACDVTFQQIQKYETGRNRVAVGRLMQIAIALRATVSALLRNVPAPPAIEMTPRPPHPKPLNVLKRKQPVPR